MILQRKQQELESMKIILKESQESDEELEKKIKDGSKMIDRLRNEIERFVLHILFCLQN